MAKANVILQNSVLWNLREVTKLAEKIKEHCGDVDCISWRYPTTNCSDLEIFKLLENNKSLDNYTFILELTYDRLLYVLNLMIKFMESHDSLMKFRPKKNVYRPKTLSLASVLHMVWDRIRAQWETTYQVESSEKLESLSENEETFHCSLKITKSTTCTQSEVSSISLCSCCGMVQEFVTQLVLDMENIIQKLNFDSAVIQERNLMNESLVDMTSWSAMSRWLSAIIKDIGVIAEKAEQATACSRKLKSRLEMGEQNVKTRLEQYVEEIRKLEMRIREYESKNLKLKQELEELTREKKHLQEEIKIKTVELASSSTNFENQMVEVKKSYEKKLKETKEKRLKKEKDREEELKQKMDSKCKKLEEMSEQIKALESTITGLNEEMESRSSKNAAEKEDLTNKTKDLENEVKELKERNNELNKALNEKQTIIENYSARLLAIYPDLNGSSKPDYKASGVPEIDMSNQIEANQIRIEQLKTENENLQKTLKKLKNLKR